MKSRSRSVMKLLPAMAWLVPLSGCVWNPVNRQNQESTTAIPLSGFVGSANEQVTFSATNLTTGAVYTFPQVATSSSTPTIVSGGYNMYGWSVSLTPAADFWTPQQAWNGLTNGPGRIEITATAGGSALDTFSATAQACVNTQMGQGSSAVAAGNACSDGKTIVAFDNDGVGNGAESAGWTIDYGPYNDNYLGDVATWEIGHYTVQQKTIYGVMCHPGANYSSPHKASLINHGAFDGITDFYLGICIGSAHAGWVAAATAYRGEWVSVHIPTGAIVTTPLSGGNIEFCLGEVTDAMRMADIVRARPDVDTTRMVMWGYSHGGCVTQKAVEHGEAVAAAAAFSGPTDFATWGIIDNNPTGLSCPLGQGVLYNTFYDLMSPPQCFASTWATIATAPAAYASRSSALYASDLAAVAPTVPFLILQGEADTTVPTDQACELASNAWGSQGQYWHFDAGGNPITSVPSSTCATPPCTVTPAAGPYCPKLTWNPNPMVLNGKTKPGRYLAVYQGQTHTSIILGGKPWNDFANFMNTAVQ